PLKVVTGLGFISVVISLLVLIYALISKFIGSQTVEPGWTSIMVAITFFAGIQLLGIGIVGEYIGRVFEESKNRPIYIVRDTVNVDDNKNDVISMIDKSYTNIK